MALDPAVEASYARIEARYDAVARARTLTVGQHVAVRDAIGRIRRAVICEVPQAWRARRGRAAGSIVWTTRGEFPKAWVRFIPPTTADRPIPWPVEDIFTDPCQLPERTDA